MKTIKQLLITTVALLLNATANAHDFEVDGIYYNITSEAEKTVQVTYKGNNSGQYRNVYKDEVVIPETVCYNDATYNVTSINNFAFFDNQKLTSVIIGNKVETIGEYAFQNCIYLTNAVIGNNVTTIGKYAFNQCYKLEKVIVGNSVKEIGSIAFYGCQNLNTVINLSSLTFKEGSDHYGYIVSYAGGYGDIVINAPNGTMVGDFLFSTAYGKNKLVKYFGNNTEIILPNNYKGENYSIDSEAFLNCDNITSVVIPDCVTEIGSNAFSDCDKLVSVEIPNSVTSIWAGAFNGCDKLADIEIPNGVVTIGDFAFAGLESLTNLEIPNSVTTIGQQAFSSCGFTSITMGTGVTKIAIKAFSGCSKLEKVNITDLAAWCKIHFETYDSNPTHIAKSIYLNGEEIIELIIPEGVTSIGQWAFVNCNNITSVTIANSTTLVDNWAFDSCKGLTMVNMGNGLETIRSAFSNCENLAHVEVSPSLKNIYSGAFADCYKLTEFIIPETVNYIDYTAFINCTGLTKIISFIAAENLFEIDSSAFYNVDKNTCTLYVPIGAKETYAATEGWNEFTNIVEMEPVSQPGDINNDGEVNIGDFAALANIIFNSESIDDAIKSVSDINADSEVNVGDFAALVNLIFNSGSQASPQRAATRAAADETTFYIEPFSIAAGETIVIPVLMENPGEKFSQLQFDITLPEGLEIPEYFDEEQFDDVKDIKRGSRTKSVYSIQTQPVGEALRVLCITQNSKAYFTGESGDVLLITVKAADDIAVGDVDIKITNTVLSRQDGTTYKPADCTATVSVTDGTGIDEVKGENGEGKTIYDLQGRKVEVPSEGLYIIDGKKEYNNPSAESV